MRHCANLKIAFTGTNCSGKTTLAMDVAARLKKNHILAELVSSQDRKVAWDGAVHAPVDFRAHYGMICKMIYAEIEAELRGDATIVVTDRSVLDLYSIALTDHPTHPAVLNMESMILSWCETYTRIYYLPPLPYQDDNKRPGDSFRMLTHSKLVELIDKYNLPNVVTIDRPLIFKDVKKLVNITSPSVFAEDAKWQAIANMIGHPLMIKEPESPITSDYDVWILADPYDYSEDANKIRRMFVQYWGPEYSEDRIDVMLAPDAANLNPAFNNKIFRPTR